MSPSFEREQIAGVIDSLVGELALELEIDMTDARFTRSTVRTFHAASSPT